jgi:hypothetical protein
LVASLFQKRLGILFYGTAAFIAVKRKTEYSQILEPLYSRR